MKLSKDQSTLKQVSDLIEYSFNKSESLLNSDLFLSRYNHGDCYGDSHDQQLTSLVMANQFQMNFYETPVKMAGVGYVSSYPEYRGDGSITKIMIEMLTSLNDEDVIVSNLAPFSQQFYRRFGYEQTIWQKHYHIPKKAFSSVKSEKSGRIVRGNWQEETIKQAVKGIYQQLTAEGTQVGSIKREDWWWERLDKYYQGRSIGVAIDSQNKPVGYLIYRMKETTFVVDELVYLNHFGLSKLVTFLKAHTTSFQDFTYHGSVDETLESCFLEQEGVSISLVPYMMSRIINFPKLLRLMPFLKDVSSLIFEVTEDSTCPWNVGKWQLIVKDNQTEWVKVAEGTADLSGPIQGWSAFILGRETLEKNLWLKNLVTEKPEKVKGVFPQGKLSFYDYF